MARKPKIPPAVSQRARDLKAQGRTREAIQKILADEGHAVSAGWISAACSEPAPPKREPKSEPPAPAADAQASPPDGTSEAPAELDPSAIASAPGILESLQEQKEFYEKLVREERDGASKHVCSECGRGGPVNIDAIAKLGRLATANAALLARLTPPKPADPNESPDVQAAAQEARELLMRAVDKAIERRAKP